MVANEKINIQSKVACPERPPIQNFKPKLNILIPREPLASAIYSEHPQQRKEIPTIQQCYQFEQNKLLIIKEAKGKSHTKT